MNVTGVHLAMITYLLESKVFIIIKNMIARHISLQSLKQICVSFGTQRNVLNVARRKISII
jgi:hypothetical protein